MSFGLKGVRYKTQKVEGISECCTGIYVFFEVIIIDYECSTPHLTALISLNSKMYRLFE